MAFKKKKEKEKKEEEEEEEKERITRIFGGLDIQAIKTCWVGSLFLEGLDADLEDNSGFYKYSREWREKGM